MIALSDCSAMWRVMLRTLKVGVWRNQTGSPVVPIPLFEDTGSFGHFGGTFFAFLLPRPTLVTFAAIVIGRWSRSEPGPAVVSGMSS